MLAWLSDFVIEITVEIAVSDKAPILTESKNRSFFALGNPPTSLFTTISSRAQRAKLTAILMPRSAHLVL